jgi:hypothetical protein
MAGKIESVRREKLWNAGSIASAERLECYAIATYGTPPRSDRDCDEPRYAALEP